MCITLSLPDLRQFLARRDYVGAIAHYLRQPANASSLRNLARVYDHWHRYDSSLHYWQRALELAPDNDSAIAGRWTALYRLYEKDTALLPSVRRLIADEASRFATDSSVRGLTLAFDGLSLADTALARDVAAQLTRLYPDSPRGYEIIGAAFYDSLYPVWTDDTAKIPLLKRFLARYPRSEWRLTFYMFLLSSRFALKDTAGLRKDAAEAIADDSLDPFRYRYAAALFNRLKFDPATAEQYARAAIHLEPLARKPANKPAEQWELEYPPLGWQSRLSLAEALMLQGRHHEARLWLEQGLSLFRWDANQEATPAPIQCLLGELMLALGDTAAATEQLFCALESGDSRNIWTARADTALCAVGYITARAQLQAGRSRARYNGPVFTDITDDCGLGGRHESRVAWGDYNNDGYDDLLLNGCRLFRNDSGKTFTDVTEEIGLRAAVGRGGVWADYNNDGWLDIWMSASSGLDRLWHNDSGRFHDATLEAGCPADSFPTEGAAWADFDNDGWVDLYCANYENWELHSYYPDRLWRNLGSSFVDWTDSARIEPPFGRDLAGRGVAWADYDNDGFQDCYVANYRLCENFLWHNLGGKFFANLAGQLGVSGDEVNVWYGHTIGPEWADYDNDGDLDLFTADLAHPRYIEFSNRSRLYENLGDKAIPRFVDRRAAAGVRYEETHSDPAWADMDNDGDLDLYITSVYEGRRSFLYLNKGRPRHRAPVSFQEVTWLSGTRCYNGWGAAFSDFDNDGDMDLAVGSGSGVRLFRNDTRNNNHWLKVRVVGRLSNRAGIGSRIEVIQRHRHQLREVQGGKGTTSQHSLVQHFGLGASAGRLTVKIRFPSGRTAVLKNVQPDQVLTVSEP
ncbi:MAG: FG-GAP-like repeat-containing protein [candidate division WOR-3 bacterium]